MSGYIGAKHGTISATVANVDKVNAQDVTATDTTPEVTIVNTTHEDTDGGREGKVIFKGQQSGGEETTLAQIEASHDGTADDEKGDLIFRTNDGSDGTSPTERLRIDSAGKTTITVEGNGNALELISTDADASIGPVLEFKRNSASPADNDQIGRIDMVGKNDADQDVDYVVYVNQIRDATDGTEDGRMAINTVVNGAMISRMNVEPTETVFNDESNDLDFRVESNGKTNCLFVDGANDKVGIGTSAPLRQLSIANSGAAEMSFTSGTSSNNSILFGDGTTGTDVYRGYIQYEHSTNAMTFATVSAERMRLKNDGQIRVGDANTQPLTYTSGNALMTEFGTLFGNHGVDIAQGAYTGGYNVLFFRNGNGTAGYIQTAGTGTTYATSSDYRLKENVAPISDGITRLKQLKPSRFNFITDADKTLDGFLAHEAATVVPEAVTGTKDALEVWKEHEKDKLPDGFSVGDNKLDDAGNTIPDIQGIDQGKLVPLLTAALQEAIAKIETLETKVAALEAG